MQTEAVFENIANRLHDEIGKAQKSIIIAVAWFTNKNLFSDLVNKAKSGCIVTLIISNDKINKNSQIDFDNLSINKSHIYKVGNGENELMHNKFCVIDYSTVITGSYNWSYKAENNFENVIITYNDTLLAEQFITEFNSIRNQYFPDVPKMETTFPLNKIIKRLEILKNYVLLEDIEELRKATFKLNDYIFNSDLKEIIEEVRKEEFASAIIKIKKFISQNQQLSFWIDPEIAAFGFEIKNLENQLSAFDNEKIELEKSLSEFHRRHTLELGDIIIEILRLQKLKFKTDKAKFEETENDERHYREQLNTERKREVYELTEVEKKELKKMFRKATVLCHPDKVNDELKEAANKIFIELKAAYDLNDLKKVAEILNDLEKGDYFKSRSETVSQKNLLKSAIAKLRMQIKILESEIILIKQNDSFKKISKIENWDAYFNTTKEKLIQELEDLKVGIEKT